jgi:hypothetical protein
MPGIDGATLRSWRRSRGWAVPEMARQLSDAAREAGVHAANHEGLIRMIYAWERGDHDLSERYELLYRRVLGTAESGPGRQDAMPPRSVLPPALSRPSALSWATPIYGAVLSPTDAARRAAATQVANARVADLRAMTGRALQASFASGYAQLAVTLPVLIGTAELANIQAAGDRPSLQELLSDIYAVTGWTLIKADSPAAAWTAAQRALQHAEDIGDVLRSAAATRCLSEVHMRARNFEEASRMAFLAATYLDTARTSERAAVVCIRGGALLSASAAAARRGDTREARTSLRAAAVCADELDEDRADLGTMFGPTNVAIHRVAVAVELGNPREAMEHVPDVHLERMPAHLTERRARFLIDVARSHAQVQDDQAAIGALTEAEAIAADELRHHRLTREVLRDLLTREHRSSGLRALADRCHALA